MNRGEIIQVGVIPVSDDGSDDSPDEVCYQLPPRQKYAAASKAFTLDLSVPLRTLWRAGEAHSAGDYVRPTKANGFAFTTAAAGQTGQYEPLWPATVGATIVDGSITWTAALPGTNATDPIVSTAWSALNNDGALTFSTMTNTAEEATVVIAGGTLGATYQVQALLTTTSGLVYDVKFDLQVT